MASMSLCARDKEIPQAWANSDARWSPAQPAFSKSQTWRAVSLYAKRRLAELSRSSRPPSTGNLQTEADAAVSECRGSFRGTTPISPFLRLESRDPLRPRLKLEVASQSTLELS